MGGPFQRAYSTTISRLPPPLGTNIQVLFGTSPGSLSPIVAQSVGNQWTVTESDAGNYGCWGGHFDVGYGYTQLPNYATGVYFELIAWSGAASYLAAQSTVGTWVGNTDVWTQAVGNQGTGAPPPIPQCTGFLPGPTMMHQVIPEPSTLVLGSVGVVAMMVLGWVRRRK